MEFSGGLGPVLVRAIPVVQRRAGSGWKCSLSGDIHSHNSICIKEVDSQACKIHSLPSGWIYFAALVQLCIPRCHQSPISAAHNKSHQPPLPITHCTLAIVTLGQNLRGDSLCCLPPHKNSAVLCSSAQRPYLDCGSCCVPGHDVSHVQHLSHGALSAWHHPVPREAEAELGLCHLDVQSFQELPRGCLGQSICWGNLHPSSWPLPKSHSRTETRSKRGDKEQRFSLLVMCVTHPSHLSSFPPPLLYLLLTHLSSLGQKEMMRGLFSPGSSVPTALTNRKGPLGFRTENPSWNSATQGKKS